MSSIFLLLFSFLAIAGFIYFIYDRKQLQKLVNDTSDKNEHSFKSIESKSSKASATFPNPIQAVKKNLDEENEYSPEEAVTLLKKLAGDKFLKDVELAVILTKESDVSGRSIKGTTILPHGIGKSVLVAVFAEGKSEKAAKEAGADLVGMEELAEQIKKGEINFDVVIASPDAMRVVDQLGPILGPRGLMPSPKTGTVTPDVATAVKNAKSGLVRYRIDKSGVIHANIGKVTFEPSEIKEKLEALLEALKKAKPASVKGEYTIRKVSLSLKDNLAINPERQKGVYKK